MPTPDQIVAQLKKWDIDYYNGQATVDDATYDKLRDHLRSVDPDNDYLKTVGAPVEAHRDEVDLIGFMGSQLKVLAEEEARDWFDKYNQPELIVSDKLDGSSMEAVYRDGKLWRVATRGSGKRGMVITKNAKRWGGLPHSIKVKGEVVVRGEAQLSVDAYNKHFSDMANPRNAGNGIVVCDSGSERNQHITFHAFDIIHPDVEFKFQDHKFKALKALGFNVVRWFKCKNWDELLKCRQHYVEDRASLSFEIDGMILDINDLEKREAAGYADGGTRPKGARAWKFSADSAESKLTAITNTIGSTGKIIPTATIEPVQLAGTTVKHILLNNFDYIAEKDINIGDIIEVTKRGDIIPHAECVVTKNTSGPYQPPKDWKGYPLTKVGKDWFVTDESCPDLVFQKIKQFIKKVNIKYLGDNALQSMVDAGLVKDIDDLYRLDYDEVAKLPIGKGVIGSNSDRIKSEVEKTKKMSIDIFIGSLSIKFLGRSRAKLIGLNTVQEYLDLTADTLAGKKCSETGTFNKDTAQEIVESIQSRKDLIERLAKVIDIEPLEQPKTVVTDGKLSGMVFCFTGCRPNDALKAAMEDEGAVIKSSVTKAVTHLVTKEQNSNSQKAQKARANGVEVIGLEDLEEMMEE